MERFYIAKTGKEQATIAETSIISNPSVLSALSSGLAWRIYREFSKPSCPIDIAKKLGLHEQKVYYYVRKFKKHGFIREVSKEQRHGTVARFYACKSPAFSVVLERDAKPYAKPPERGLLEPFVHNGVMNSTVIVGSPDPHGPYKSRASDSCCAIDLALFIGSFTERIALPNYRLDVQLRGESDLKGNLILVGGPVANMITHRVNEKMPAYFDMGSMAAIRSRATGIRYTEEECGLISVLQNPFDSSGKMLVLAGNRFVGTRSAVLALIKRPAEMLRGIEKKVPLSRVVKGFDADGDGIIDNAEVME